MASNSVGYDRRSVRSAHEAKLSDLGEILFREFRPDVDDERQMGELLFNNAFLGQPFDPICSCKEWFRDVVLTPYIRYQPEDVHVAVHKPSGRLVGYLTGSRGGQRFEKLQYDMVRRKVLSLALSLTMPWTYFDLSSRQFASHVIFKGESERPSRPQSGVHWHFQVDKEFRGQGVGTELLRRFIVDAIADKFDLIWAEVTAYPEKPPEYFEDKGWSVFDAKPTQIFGNHVDFPVQTLCITKSLTSFQTLTHAA